MIARETLSYEPKPLPDRMQRSDEEMIAAANAHLAIMRQRHSVRDFDPRPVPRSIIEDCIQTAGLAPSGANHQPTTAGAFGGGTGVPPCNSGMLLGE